MKYERGSRKRSTAQAILKEGCPVLGRTCGIPGAASDIFGAFQCMYDASFGNVITAKRHFDLKGKYTHPVHFLSY